MRVPNINVQDNMMTQLSNLRQRQVKLQEQISTGQRLSSISDDPAATERVMRNETEKRELTQYRRNQERVQQTSQASFAQVERMQEIAARGQEITLLSSSVVADDYFVPYAAEMNQLLEEMVERANYTYMGQHVFAGTATDTPPFDVTRDGSGAITAVTYVGNTDTAAVNISDNSTLSGFMDPTRNADIETLFANLIAVRDGLVAEDAAAVTAVADDLFVDENNLVEGLGEMAGIQARIENTMRFDEFAFLRADQRIGDDVDADLAAVAIEYSQAETAYQAALATSADLLQRSLFDFI